MKGSKKIYLSEFAINLFSAKWMMLSANEFVTGGEIDEEISNIIDDLHIYLICKSPSLSFFKDSFEFKDGNVCGHIQYSVEGIIKKKAFKFPIQLLDGGVEVALSKYPHREIVTLDKNGNIVRRWTAFIVSLFTCWHFENEDLKNLQVLYVGQAYGDSSRTPFDRLKNHSTFQKILAQTQYDSPESEIQILMFEYLPYRIINFMDGSTKNVISDFRDIERFRNVMTNHLTEHQQICLVEAGLIRYFQPPYNLNYKDSFPNDNHKILESVYDLDFSALSVEINTEEYRFSLFSESRAANEHHICKIELYESEKRWAFFHYPSHEGGSVKIADVIRPVKK